LTCTHFLPRATPLAVKISQHRRSNSPFGLQEQWGFHKANAVISRMYE
jgi:hypothetical protein